MANYNQKGRERMAALGRKGGIKSGETRRYYALSRGLDALLSIYMTCRSGGCTDEQVAEALVPEERRGGSHDSDWRCPHCHHFSSSKRRACRECGRVAPRNGRLTRAALRTRAAEHLIDSILAKHGL